MRNNKVTFVTNVILIALLAVVFTFSFFSKSIVPISIYGKGNNSPYYYGNREKNDVSLMFNVYENAGIVNSIIDVLEENKIKATFFMGGCFADDNKLLLERIVATGNEIANHGYFHKDHSTISYSKNREEIYNTEQIIEMMCGVKTRLFAPPSGAFSSVTLDVCEELGYKVIMWSKDTIDWRDKDTNKIFQRATKNLSAGDLILMHPKEHTLNILPKIIDNILTKGYNLVTVSENIGVNI